MKTRITDSDRNAVATEFSSTLTDTVKCSLLQINVVDLFVTMHYEDTLKCKQPTSQKCNRNRTEVYFWLTDSSFLHTYQNMNIDMCVCVCVGGGMHGACVSTCVRVYVCACVRAFCLCACVCVCVLLLLLGSQCASFFFPPN